MKLVTRFWNFLITWAEIIAEYRSKQKYHNYY